MKEEEKKFLDLFKDIVALRDKHGVTWEYLARFVTLYSEFGWEVGTALVVGNEDGGQEK